MSSSFSIYERDGFTPKPISSFTSNVIKIPEPSDYKCKVGGVTYRPLKGEEPNGFHRLMQRLILGIAWERV